MHLLAFFHSAACNSQAYANSALHSCKKIVMLTSKTLIIRVHTITLIYRADKLAPTHRAAVLAPAGDLDPVKSI
jgi:hypothetical protein